LLLFEFGIAESITVKMKEFGVLVAITFKTDNVVAMEAIISLTITTAGAGQVGGELGNTIIMIYQTGKQ
jgi:predicted glycosyltransferase